MRDVGQARANEFKFQLATLNINPHHFLTLGRGTAVCDLPATRTVDYESPELHWRGTSASSLATLSIRVLTDSLASGGTEGLLEFGRRKDNPRIRSKKVMHTGGHQL